MPKQIVEESVSTLRSLSERLQSLANKIVTTEYALEIRSVAGALDAEAERLAGAPAEGAEEGGGSGLLARGGEA
jgi:hypothetical protein